MPVSVGLAELLAIGGSLTFSVALVSLRQGMRSATPMAAILLVNSLVTAVGLGAAFLGGMLQSSSLSFILWFLLGGALGPGLGSMAAYIGIERMGVSRATPISGSSPLWNVFFAAALLGERPGVPVWVGTLCVVAGVFLLSVDPGEERGSFREWFRGALVFPLAASLFFSIAPIFAKFAFVHQKTPLVGIGVGFAAGTVVLLAGRPLFPGRGKVRADLRAVRWFVLAAAFNFVSATMVLTAIMVGEVSVVFPLSRLTPLWVVVLSYLFLGKMERITGRVVLAAALVVAGGVLITGFRG